MGPEISRLRNRPRSGLGGASRLRTEDVGERLPGSFDFLLSRFNFDFSFDKLERGFDSECSGDDGASEPTSESSIRQTTASGFGGLTTDQVGVMTVVTGRGDLTGADVVVAVAPRVTSAAPDGELEPLNGGWWMIGGVLGLVGLGRVMGSQKTTPRDVRSLNSRSALLFPARIELWETPVDGAFEISEAAEDVAAVRMGRLITGLPD